MVSINPTFSHRLSVLSQTPRDLAALRGGRYSMFVPQLYIPIVARCPKLSNFLSI